MENNLPKGWIECSIGEILISRKGKKPSSTITEPKDGYLPYILIDEMEGKPVRAYTNDKSVPLVSKKDVLLVWDGSIGKCGSGLEGVIGSTLVALTPQGDIPTKFLEYIIRNVNPFIKETSTGTGLQHVNKDFFKECIIPLPPLPEQQRIVEKLDGLMARISNSKTRLEKIPALLKNFRQSVLAAAVSGELTKNEFKNESWRELTGKDVFEFITSGSRGWAQYYSETGKLFIRVTNLDFDTIKIDVSEEKNKYVNPPRNAEGIRTKVITNDILISITGDVGMVGLVDETITEAYVNQHVCLARPQKDYYPSFIAYYISSVNGGRKYFDEVKKGATKAGLGLDDIRNLPINVPAVEEQKEIVRKVEELFHFADSIEARYQKAKVWFDKLPQAMLAKAFRGELVPQNENDEPASVLLERIKKDKQIPSKNIKRVKRENKKSYKTILSFMVDIQEPVTQSDILQHVNLEPSIYLIELNDLVRKGILKKIEDKSQTKYELILK